LGFESGPIESAGLKPRALMAYLLLILVAGLAVEQRMSSE